MIDFHCHLDLYPEPQSVVRGCVERNTYVLAVTTTPSAWKGTCALVERAQRIRVALGLHPELARERKHEMSLFDQLLPETQYIGEVGLDGSSEARVFWDDQVDVFERILSICASAGGRIMSIHSRRAASAVLDRLEANPRSGTAVLHWFSGSRAELGRAIELGCWFSVGPAMLHGAKGRDLVSRLPRDRVLTETDGPFALIEGNAAMPWDAARAIPIFAELWETDEIDADRVIHSNLRRLMTTSR